MRTWFSMNIENGLKIGKICCISQSKPKDLFSQVNPLDNPASSEETTRRFHKKQEEHRNMEERRGKQNLVFTGVSKHREKSNMKIEGLFEH
jgi:hypothetical protein